MTKKLILTIILLLALAGTGWASTNYYLNGRYSMAGSASGSFTYQETITQAVSGATAIYWGTGTGTLIVSGITGSPDNSHVWTGALSGQTWTPTAVPTVTTYVDPLNNTWGAGSDSNNGTSMATPKLTFYNGVSAVGNTNGNTLTIAPATYIHSTSLTQLTTADRTGIVMAGADSIPANWPIIDGTGLTGAYAVRARGTTTIRYIAFINCTNSTTYAIDSSNANDIITVEYCLSLNNYGLLNNNSTVHNIVRYCSFVDSLFTDINTSTNFTTASLTCYYNKFLGSTVTAVNNIELLGTNGNTNPSVYLYGNLFAGTSNNAVRVNGSYDGNLTAENNDFRGLLGYAVNVLSGSLCVPTLANNSYISGGWPTGSYVNLNKLLSGCTDSNPITDQTLYAGGRGTGYIIFRKDDNYDTSTTNLDYSVALAQKLASYGWKLTFGAVWSEAQPGVTSAGGTIAQTQQIAATGAEMANHTVSHAGLPNTTVFTIAYTGPGTWSLSSSLSGSPPNDTNSLVLNESSIPLNNVTIDLVAGTISGDTWNQTAISNRLTNMQGVRNYLASKSVFTVGTIPTTGPTAIATIPYYMKSQSLSFSALSGAGTKNVTLDSTNMTYYEVTNHKALWATQGVTISNTLIYPFFLYDANVITRIKANGCTVGLQDAITASYTTVGSQLRNLQIFEIPQAAMNDTKGLSDANLRKWTTQVCEALASQLKVITIMTHGPDQGWTAAQQDIVFQEIQRHPNVQVVSASQFQAIVAGGLWATADAGTTYTRNFRSSDQIGVYSPSPLIGAGVRVSGLTKDFAGNSVFAVNPCIGPYEWQRPVRVVGGATSNTIGGVVPGTVGGVTP